MLFLKQCYDFILILNKYTISYFHFIEREAHSFNNLKICSKVLPQVLYPETKNIIRISVIKQHSYCKMFCITSHVLLLLKGS